jgi:hypothetical protein
MKKFIHTILMLAVVFLFGISQLTAQTILCVDRDFGDTAAGNVFTDTWPPISRALDAAGYTYDYWEVMVETDNGPDATYMGNYDVVIWFTGEAWDAGQTMGPDDEFNLLLYMSVGGGKLFMNSQDYLYDWYGSYGTFSEGEFPYDQLGVVTVVQDVYNIEEEGGDADSLRVTGIEGTLAEGLTFTAMDIFTTDKDDGLYADSIAEYLGESLFTIEFPYISTGATAVTYETEYFRSVFSTLEIASIEDTVKRDILMHRIVDWLMYGLTGVSELAPNDVNLLIKPNPVADFVNIGMTVTMDEVTVYNSQGQIVRHEITNRSSVKMDLGNLPGGLYIVKIKTAEGIVTDKILKL